MCFAVCRLKQNIQKGDSQMSNQNISTVREAAALPMTAHPLPAVVEQTALMVFERFSDRLKARLNGRQERALQLALNGHVTHKGGRVYSVRSQEGKHHYLVNLDRKFCNCPDSRKGHLCKHRIAAYLIEQANQAIKETSPPFDETIERVRKVLKARSDFLQEAIIYGALQYEGQSLKVEIIDIEGNAAFIRALPEIKEGELKPQFPFLGRKSCTKVMTRSLTNITIYR
jgi:hypothetical protein